MTISLSETDDAFLHESHESFSAEKSSPCSVLPAGLETPLEGGLRSQL